jgi:hypothetical protein
VTSKEFFYFRAGSAALLLFKWRRKAQNSSRGTHFERLFQETFRFPPAMKKKPEKEVQAGAGRALVLNQ